MENAPEGARGRQRDAGPGGGRATPRPGGPGVIEGRRRDLLVAAGLLAGGLGVVWGLAQWRYPLPDLRADTLATVRLYAGNEEIATFQGTSRRSQVSVPLAHIPRPVVDAVLAAEDRRFFQHWGIDLRAVLRAAVANVREGTLRQGGSTITQQLVRTLFLGTQRTWARKLRESALALLLEWRYPKDRILEAYLNSVYLGHDGDVAIHGVGAAARHFLGKDLEAVRLDEAALLAAAIRAPNRVLSPNSPQTKPRRDAVLKAMREQGLAGEAAIRAAIANPLPPRPAGEAIQAPYFVDLAREEIARRVALPPSGEVRIATTLDPNLQRTAEKAVREGLERLERRQPGLGPGWLQAALVAIEPASGHIRALVGGRRYRESPFNRATKAARQPGSLFKPIVYLAAFEAEREGRGPRFTPATLIPDEPITILAGTSTWSPQNFDHRFRGPVTVRRALEASLNVPAVRVAQEVGLVRVAGMARALGIERPLSVVPSLALGSSEATPLEITAAFATLANGGVRTTPTTLGTSPALEGGLLPEPLSQPARVVSEESAFLITHILRGVLRSGTARASGRWGLSEIAAGKTGTTDGLRDAWFVGYTPGLAVGVWVGMDDGSPIGLTGAQAALPIWAAVMRAAVRRAPPQPFASPPGIVMASVDRDTGRLASFWCGGGPVIEEAFRTGSEPRGAGCDDSPVWGTARPVVGWIQGLFQ